LIDCRAKGPLNLALDAFKQVAVALCWVESDQAAPPTRQSANFWLLPRLAALQLRIIEQLTAGFAHISAPRQVSRTFLK
jgi:hypothetical protein